MSDENPDTSTPSGFLKTAIRAVPAVKYALGVGGIVAVLAIIAGFEIDLRYGLLGTPAMVVLMILLLVFARLTKANSSMFHLPATVLLWFSVIMMMACVLVMFTSAFWGWPLDWRGRAPSPRDSGQAGTESRQSPASINSPSPQRPITPDETPKPSPPEVGPQKNGRIKKIEKTKLSEAQESSRSNPPTSNSAPGGIINNGGTMINPTVNNFGPPPAPVPTVSLCVHPPTLKGKDYETEIVLKTDTAVSQPEFAFYFSGPILDGAYMSIPGTAGNQDGRDTASPNPERSYWFRLTFPDWAPGSPITIKIPSQQFVTLLRVTSSRKAQSTVGNIVPTCGDVLTDATSSYPSGSYSGPTFENSTFVSAGTALLDCDPLATFDKLTAISTSQIAPAVEVGSANCPNQESFEEHKVFVQLRADLERDAGHSKLVRHDFEMVKSRLSELRQPLHYQRDYLANLDQQLNEVEDKFSACGDDRAKTLQLLSLVEITHR